MTEEGWIWTQLDNAHKTPVIETEPSTNQISILILHNWRPGKNMYIAFFSYRMIDLIESSCTIMVVWKAAKSLVLSILTLRILTQSTQGLSFPFLQTFQVSMDATLRWLRSNYQERLAVFHSHYSNFFLSATAYRWWLSRSGFKSSKMRHLAHSECSWNRFRTTMARPRPFLVSLLNMGVLITVRKWGRDLQKWAFVRRTERNGHQEKRRRRPEWD